MDQYTVVRSEVPAAQPGFAQESQLHCSFPLSQLPLTQMLPITPPH